MNFKMNYVLGYAKGNGKMPNTITAIEIALRLAKEEQEKSGIGDTYFNYASKLAYAIVKLGISDDFTVASAILCAAPDFGIFSSFYNLSIMAGLSQIDKALCDEIMKVDHAMSVYPENFPKEAEAIPHMCMVVLADASQPWIIFNAMKSHNDLVRIKGFVSGRLIPCYNVVISRFPQFRDAIDYMRQQADDLHSITRELVLLQEKEGGVE